MKIKIPTTKPRAKQVNEVLRTKRCEKHTDRTRPSRSQLKQQINKMY